MKPAAYIKANRAEATLCVASEPSGAPVRVQRMVRPFVVIDPYQYEGDVAFGVWTEQYNRYLLGDGDYYNAEELARSWPDAELLTWSELEARLKRPNAKLRDAGESGVE